MGPAAPAPGPGVGGTQHRSFLLFHWLLARYSSSRKALFPEEERSMSAARAAVNRARTCECVRGEGEASWGC